MGPIFLDSNVFLYAVGRVHPLREPCRSVLRRIADGTVVANTSAEIVQELLYVLARRGRAADGIRLSRSVMGLFPALLPITADEMALACDLLEDVPELPSRDAIHAATMRNHGLELIVSADRHFDHVAGIRRMDPAAIAGSSG